MRLKFKEGETVYWDGGYIVLTGIIRKIQGNQAIIIMSGYQRRNIPLVRLSRKRPKIKYKRKFNSFQKDSDNGNE